jgi:ribosomal protein S4
MTPEESRKKRREYQRAYYGRNKEKARSYRAQYQLAHRKKAKARAALGLTVLRQVVRTTFTRSDIMHLPFGGRTERILNDIVQGRKTLTA